MDSGRVQDWLEFWFRILALWISEVSNYARHVRHAIELRDITFVHNNSVIYITLRSYKHGDKSKTYALQSNRRVPGSSPPRGKIKFINIHTPDLQGKNIIFGGGSQNLVLLALAEAKNNRFFHIYTL